MFTIFIMVIPQTLTIFILVIPQPFTIFILVIPQMFTIFILQYCQVTQFSALGQLFHTPIYTNDNKSTNFAYKFITSAPIKLSRNEAWTSPLDYRRHNIPCIHNTVTLHMKFIPTQTIKNAGINKWKSNSSMLFIFATSD